MSVIVDCYFYMYSCNYLYKTVHNHSFIKMLSKKVTSVKAHSVCLAPHGKSCLGSQATFTLTRNSDMITNICIKLKLPQIKGGDWYNLHKIIKRITFEIGGKTMCDMSSERLNVENAKDGINTIIPQVKFLEKVPEEVYVNIPLWFTKNKCGLPMRFLTHQEKVLHVYFEEVDKLVRVPLPFDPLSPQDISKLSTHDLDAQLVVEGCKECNYLDQAPEHPGSFVTDVTLENTCTLNFAENTTDYVFNFTLPTFEHGVKNLMWMFYNQFGDSVDVTNSMKMNIQVDGHDQSDDQNPIFFNRIQQRHSKFVNNLFCYSLVEDPNNHMSSGVKCDEVTLRLRVVEKPKNKLTLRLWSSCYHEFPLINK